MSLIKVAELSEQLELTPQNTFKIVHLLTRSGFLKATRGRHGGVQLAHEAAAIGVGDVVRAIEALSSEAAGEPVAPGLDPGQVALFDDAFESFIAVLNQASIADLAQAKRPAPKLRASSGAKAARKPSKAVNVTVPRSQRRSAAIVR